MRNILIDSDGIFSDTNAVALTIIKNQRQFIWLSAVFFVAAVMLTQCNDKPAQIYIGQTVDQCTALYGAGTLENFFAPHSKTIQYTKPSDTVQVVFYDNVATGVYYHIGSVDLNDKKIKNYLDLNAEGHVWNLREVSKSNITHGEWVRNDGATASYYGGGGTSGMLSVESPKSK